MKPFKYIIKDICALIAYIGPLLIIGLDNFNIVFKAIIASITFLYNAFYYYRTSNLEKEYNEFKYNHIQKVKHYEEWQKKDGEYINKPVDQFNHFMDALRYSLQCVGKRLQTMNKSALSI